MTFESFLNLLVFKMKDDSPEAIVEDLKEGVRLLSEEGVAARIAAGFRFLHAGMLILKSGGKDSRDVVAYFANRYEISQ